MGALDTGAASIYTYRDVNMIPLFIGLTTRGVRRQHEIAESKIWWPLVVSCNIEHYPTFEAAASREFELKCMFSPVFNSQDKHNSLRDYYRMSTDPKQLDTSAAEMRRLRLRWRALPHEMRQAAKCIRCEVNLSLELLDGSCALCHYLDWSRKQLTRLDGKHWGSKSSIKNNK